MTQQCRPRGGKGASNGRGRGAARHESNAPGSIAEAEEEDPGPDPPESLGDDGTGGEEAQEELDEGWTSEQWADWW